MLPKGTVQFQTVSKASYQAKITEDGKNLEFETEELAQELGKIRLPDDMRKHVEPGDVVSFQLLQSGFWADFQVSFKILESKRTGDRSATEISVVQSVNGSVSDDKGTLLRGTVILKKDSYGFIESEDHTRETFFHYSELSCKPEELETGAAVQYYEALKDNKVGWFHLLRKFHTTSLRFIVYENHPKMRYVEPMSCYYPVILIWMPTKLLKNMCTMELSRY